MPAAVAIPLDYTDATVAPAVPRGAWQALHYLNVYRLTLAAVFAVLYFADARHSLLGTHNPVQFLGASVFYVLGAGLSSWAARLHRPAFKIQLRAGIVLDITALTLLIHANGGMDSSIGMLMLVSISITSLIASQRLALLFAAASTLAILGEQVYAHINQLFPVHYTRAGMLGAMCFATAILTHGLAQRMRDSEALAARRGLDLANMEQLNAYIIRHMQPGVVVVDANGYIRLINDSAWYLLGTGVAGNKTQSLAGLAPQLAAQLRSWRKDPDYEPQGFHTAAGMHEVLPRFAALGNAADGGVILFLDDGALRAAQAQQMKLASLGRFSASIAHEIRNPLGAISHASQLLAETATMDPGDRRLVNIIVEQCRRVNTIIENVLQLSRRQASHPENFLLAPWLENFVAEFARHQNIDNARVTFDIQPADVLVRMDPSHLQQVMTNLCENAVRHGKGMDATPRLQLRGGLVAEVSTPFLDVIDSGPGIEPERVRQIFEPFFTTAPTGTGLGLYIARELCEFNQAKLMHIATPSGGSCFRISFADPRRQVL